MRIWSLFLNRRQQQQQQQDVISLECLGNSKSATLPEDRTIPDALTGPKWQQPLAYGVTETIVRAWGSRLETIPRPRRSHCQVDPSRFDPKASHLQKLPSAAGLRSEDDPRSLEAIRGFLEAIPRL